MRDEMVDFPKFGHKLQIFPYTCVYSTTSKSSTQTFKQHNRFIGFTNQFNKLLTTNRTIT